MRFRSSDTLFTMLRKASPSGFLPIFETSSDCSREFCVSGLVGQGARDRPPGGVARRGLEGVDTDRGKVIAGGGAGDDGKRTSK